MANLHVYAYAYLVKRYFPSLAVTDVVSNIVDDSYAEVPK